MTSAGHKVVFATVTASLAAMPAAAQPYASETINNLRRPKFSNSSPVEAGKRPESVYFSQFHHSMTTRTLFVAVRAR